MKISLDEARRVAALAALEFGEEDLARVAGEMSRILDYVDQVSAVDLSSVPDGGEAIEGWSRMDEVHPSGLDAEVGENAPSVLHGHFVVPKVIGGE